MNWNNLKETKCPICEGKLSLRMRGKTFTIKANKGKTKGKDEDWYFCSKKGCSGFQISKTRYVKLLTEMESDLKKKFKNNPLFKTGLLKL